MRAGNTVPADQIFARDAIVSLLIPKDLRLAGELRRVNCRVIQHTTAGYQLNTKWGLLSGRFAHSDLNGVDDEVDEIPKLTVQEQKKH